MYEEGIECMTLSDQAGPRPRALLDEASGQGKWRLCGIMGFFVGKPVRFHAQSVGALRQCALHYCCQVPGYFGKVDRPRASVSRCLVPDTRWPSVRCGLCPGIHKFLVGKERAAGLMEAVEW